MILESCYWKDPLLESATFFEDLEKRVELSEEDVVKVEKDVFIGFYSIRKIMDTIKVSDSTKSFNLVVVWFKNIKNVDECNSYRIDKLYDLTVGNKEIRSLHFICNQIVHSFIFTTAWNETGGLGGIMFSSDKDKDSKLYFLETKQLIEIFRLLGNDYPQNLSRKQDNNTGKFKTTVW